MKAAIDSSHSAHAGHSGLIRIDIGGMLGRLRAAAGQKTVDRYLTACAAVQVWADLLAIDKPKPDGEAMVTATTTEEIKTQLRHAECEADHAAQVLLGKVAPMPMVTDDLASVRPVHLALRRDSRPDSLSKLLHLPMPECCGYDLADIELIAGDGKRLALQVGLDRSILIIGIRTGGAYLAPLWKAVLTGLGISDVHWCTVRPPAGHEVFDDLKIAQAWFERRLAPVVVVVDDQPDTGTTMERVATLLRAPGIDLWFSSIGKLWRDRVTQPIPVRSPVSLIRNRHPPRLWECLLPNDHPGFISRLRDTPGLPTLPAQARLQFRCPESEARYGIGRAWLPWNDPKVLNGRRQLVNPRKTPVVVCRPDGAALLHLRFIGEGVFGRTEFQRVQDIYRARGIEGTRLACFIDGYVVTVDIGDARPFREQFHAASPSVRTNLLVQAANWLTVYTQQFIAHAPDSPVVMALGPRWSAIVEVMRERCGCDRLLEIPESLGAFLTQPAPWPGRMGRVIRSSLRYACGAWHWQVDHRGQLHRFQMEANWGDVSFPELELAAFILENRLALVDAQHLASLCGMAYSSIRESLSLAALLIAEARVRSVKTLSDNGRIALVQDFHQLSKTTIELAGLKLPLGK